MKENKKDLSDQQQFITKLKSAKKVDRSPVKVAPNSENSFLERVTTPKLFRADNKTAYTTTQKWYTARKKTTTTVKPTVNQSTKKMQPKAKVRSENSADLMQSALEKILSSIKNEDNQNNNREMDKKSSSNLTVDQVENKRKEPYGVNLTEENELIKGIYALHTVEICKYLPLNITLRSH